LVYENLQWYGQRCVEHIPRLRGSGNHHIQYRHIIDWLVRKPGAFANYRYRKDLFPSSRFRIAYDRLCEHYAPTKAAQHYLRILQLAALENETGVDDCLRYLIDERTQISADKVTEGFYSGVEVEAATDISIDDVSLSGYDQLVTMEVAG
jgi:hypothetical protein